MIRLIKRYFAIKAYVYRLSQELARRFEIQRFYTIEQVSQTIERAGLSKVFLAYAHALYCSRKDFEAYYEPLHVRCDYNDLRRQVSRRYFGGTVDFDASNIIHMTKRWSGSFYESAIGEQGGGDGGGGGSSGH